MKEPIHQYANTYTTTHKGDSSTKIFKNPGFGQVRTIVRDDEPWFVAADVCRALEVSNSRDAVARLDEDEKGVVLTDTPGGRQEMTIVNEPGLYSLVLGSRKPEAKAFKRWITHEVIPTIRKTGAYSINPGAAQLRAQAMLLNARTRQFKAIMQTISDKTKLPAIAVEVFALKTLQGITGADVGNLLPECDRTYSATEVGNKFNVSPAKIGKIANQNNLKCQEYGRYVLDKSPNSAKLVESFRYNAKGVDRIGKLLGQQ